MIEKITGFIPAGGMGTRLQPLTAEQPKPYLLMGSGHKRLIDYPLGVMSRESNIIVTVGYLGEMLLEYLESYHENKQLTVLQDSRLSNIGGSLAEHLNVMETKLSDYTLIIPADHIVEGLDMAQLQKKHEEQKSEITILAVEPLMFGDYVNVDCHNIVKGVNNSRLESTSRYSSTGIYLFNTNFLLRAIKRKVKQGWQGEAYDITRDLVFPSIESGRVHAFVLGKGGYWDDTGTIARYYRNNMRLSNGTNIVASSARIDSRVTLEDSIVLDNTTLSGDVTIKNSIVSANTIVKESSHSTNSITIFSREGGKKHAILEKS